MLIINDDYKSVVFIENKICYIYRRKRTIHKGVNNDEIDYNIVVGYENREFMLSFQSKTKMKKCYNFLLKKLKGE